MSDPRLMPARSDLAAAKLRGHVDAPRYVDGRQMHVAAELADLRRAPAHDAALDTQALHGETITVYDQSDGWAWGQIESDGYVGYVAAHALGAGAATPTHRVAVTRTHIYPRADIKVPPLGAMPLGADVEIVAFEGAFVRTVAGGFVFAAHLMPADSMAADFVAIAEGLIGTAYLWGGKSALGIDCSGLVQLACRQAGIPAPRDTDLQLRELGTSLPDTPLDGLRRGDLVFWRGHVGIMRDGHELLHANAHHMRVTSEPLAIARARIKAGAASEIIAINRLSL